MFFRINSSLAILFLLYGCGGGGSSPSTSTPTTQKTLGENISKESESLSGFYKDIFDIHNVDRNTLFTDSNLVWNDTLKVEAKKYADTLAKSGKFEHDPDNNANNFGENLFAQSTNAVPDPKTVMKMWFDDEKPFYNYDDGSCVAGEKCGHYTQVAWQKTSEVGCDYSQYQTGDLKGGFVVVCKYQDAGNIVGDKPYCTNYTNSDIQNNATVKSSDLAGKSLNIEIADEDRSKCERVDNFNSAIVFSSDMKSASIQNFQIFNKDSTYPKNLNFTTITISENEIKMSGKNTDKNGNEGDSYYMNIKFVGNYDNYYGMKLDWNGYDPTKPQYSRQMLSKLHK